MIRLLSVLLLTRYSLLDSYDLSVFTDSGCLINNVNFVVQIRCKKTENYITTKKRNFSFLFKHVLSTNNYLCYIEFL